MTIANIIIPDDWARVLTDDINQANHSIIGTALSMLPPRTTQTGPWQAMWDALCAAAARHVRIKITLPAPNRAHPATAQNATGARVAHDRGMMVTMIHSPRLLHAKQFIIDEEIVWIGSGNMTAAAYAHNHETWLRMESRPLAARLALRIAAYAEK